MYKLAVKENFDKKLKKLRKKDKAASTEKSGAPFISCDDRLIKKCLNYKIKIWCGNPVIFCEKEGLR
ncbi:MAG: hypothetical protein KAH35_00605 [Candidatus Atribacteria bacterium]|nr:hypothetical protein [Candidatus Atribacteria bacterium]